MARFFCTWFAAIAVIFMWLAMAAKFDAQRAMIEQQDRQALAERIQKALVQACGPGAYAAWLDDSTIECRMHNGRGRPYRVAAGKQP